MTHPNTRSWCTVLWPGPRQKGISLCQIFRSFRQKLPPPRSVHILRAFRRQFRADLRPDPGRPGNGDSPGRNHRAGRAELQKRLRCFAGGRLRFEPRSQNDLLPAQYGRLCGIQRGLRRLFCFKAGKKLRLSARSSEGRALRNRGNRRPVTKIQRAVLPAPTGGTALFFFQPYLLFQPLRKFLL